MPDALLNDTYGFQRPLQISPRRVEWPFEANGDLASTLTQVDYIMLRAYYIPAKVGVDRDPGDPLGYVAAPDSNRSYDLRTQQLRFTRTYARIPGQQTVYGSRPIDRPVMHDIFVSGSYAVSFDNGLTSHVFTARTAASLGAVDVPNDVVGAKQGSLPAATVTIGKNAGGAFTFSTSDSGSTIQAAFASGFGSSSYVARSDRGISVTGASLAIKYVDVSGTGIATSLSGAISSDQALDISVDLGNANAASVRRVTTSIAAAVGRYMAVWNGDKLGGWGKVVATDGSTYSDLELAEVPGKDFAITHAAVVGVTASTRYVNGLVSCSIKEVTDFALPGVTSGITTPADIALVVAKLDPISWLTAIQAATAYLVIEGSQLERWLGGPIYAQTTISVQMSDALDTVTTTA